MNQQTIAWGVKPFTALRLRSAKRCENGQPAEGYLPAVAAAMVLHRHHIQAIVEILAKTPGIHLSARSRWVAAISRTSTEIVWLYRHAELRAPESHAADAPASSRDIANFIEKQRAAVRLNKAPSRRLSAPVNAPFS